MEGHEYTNAPYRRVPVANDLTTKAACHGWGDKNSIEASSVIAPVTTSGATTSPKLAWRASMCQKKNFFRISIEIQISCYR